MSNRSRTIALVTALVTLIVLTGCNGLSGTHRPATTDGDTKTAARTTIDRKTVRIPDGKPAVVFFFSATCGSCLAAGKAVVKVHRQATDKADFLLVDLDPTEPRTAIETFRARIGDKSLPMVSKGAAELAQAWQVTALSTVVVVDAAGTVTYRVTDAPAADILAAIDEATKQ